MELLKLMLLHAFKSRVQVRTCNSDFSRNIVLQKIELGVKVMLHDMILIATF